MARGRKGSSKSTRSSVRDKARQAAETRERGGGGLDTLKDIPREVEFFSPKMGRGNKGKNYFSIVPYVVSLEGHPFQDVGEMWPECTYWQHKIGVGTDSKRFICPAKTAQAEDNRCPICEYRQALLKSGQDPELADSLKSKQRQIFNVLDHNEENKGIQLLEMSPHMFGFMLDDEDKAQAEDFEDRYYGDYQNGLQIIARFAEGNYMGNKFPECVRIDFEERDDLEEELVMEESVDLDAHLRILDYDELHAKFFELDTDSEEEDGEEQDDSEEEEEKPKRSRGRKKPEPEPEEKPKRSRRKKKEPEPEPERDPEPDEGDCPHGHTFGTDCDNTDDCDDCQVWEDCRDEYDELAAKKKKDRKK